MRGSPGNRTLNLRIKSCQYLSTLAEILHRRRSEERFGFANVVLVFRRFASRACRNRVACIGPLWTHEATWLVGERHTFEILSDASARSWCRTASVLPVTPRLENEGLWAFRSKQAEQA
jgi:hypothetical protein